MNFFKLFDILKYKPPIDPKEVLHLWEDDYLMKVLLPKENLEFVKIETQRINSFGEEHATEYGFTDVIAINSEHTTTLEKQISFSEIALLLDGNFPTINNFYYQGQKVETTTQSLLAYGTSRGAILIEQKGAYLEHIYITGKLQHVSDRDKVSKVLQQLVTKYPFIGVNWYSGEYYDLSENGQIAKFIENV